MKKIVFGFSRPKVWKPYAAAIMWCDDIPYSHAYTKFSSSSWGVDFIYQQSGSQTNFMSGEHFLSKNISVVEFEAEVDEDTFNSVGHHCVSREGLSYGILQTLGKALVKSLFIASFGFIRMRNPIKSGTDCIEEQALLMSFLFGIDVPLDMDSVTVRPYRDFIASLPQVKRLK